jgi:hypothetical protein
MKILYHQHRKKNGSTVVVVIALLFVLVSMMAINQRALFQLHRQIEMTDRHQLKKYGAMTNAELISVPGKESTPAPEKK